MQHSLGLAARMRAMAMHCALGRGGQGGEIDTINGFYHHASAHL